MPPEVLALMDKPLLLIAILAIGAFIGMNAEKFFARMRRKAWREKNRSPWDGKQHGRSGPGETWTSSRDRLPPNQPDAADQLRIVMGADFTARSVLNRSEARVFKELDRIVIGCNPDWQVMAQVSLGEILSCRDPQAYGCINSKRVDLLLMDGECQPRHAIEYQGGAHHQKAAAARDAVKKEALRRAGIGYHEVVGGHTTPAELRRLVEKLVDAPIAPAQRPTPAQKLG
jgi:hypothetical protein